MGIEDMGLDLKEQIKLNVTTPGEAGYRSAWDKNPSNPDGSAPSPEMVRDAAINSATLEDLTQAIERLKDTSDPEELEALAKIRGQIDAIIQRHQN